MGRLAHFSAGKYSFFEGELCQGPTWQMPSHIHQGALQSHTLEDRRTHSGPSKMTRPHSNPRITTRMKTQGNKAALATNHQECL